MLLPAELIDHIFSFLRKDTLALNACSKAHPLYSRLAERYLYAHIVIDPEVCNLILENPRLLDHPRSLEFDSTKTLLSISIMSIIPQMTNLVSLSISFTCPVEQRDEFISTFRNCLQQSSFQELHLFNLYDLPFSILDDAKNIKKLTLSDTTADEDEPISSSPSSQLSLETLVLSGFHDADIHRWATRWVTRLTTLELHNLWLDLDWTLFPELLAACSNSLTNLHLDTDYSCMSYPSLLSRIYIYFIGDNNEFPFTLSVLMRLKRLSISTLITTNATESSWALPEIIRLVNTAPAIHDVVIQSHCHVSDSITSLGQLNWSLLDDLRSNCTGERPRIDLCVTGEGTLGPEFCSESILDALAENQALMDLVKRGQVLLKSERTWGY